MNIVKYDENKPRCGRVGRAVDGINFLLRRPGFEPWEGAAFLAVFFFFFDFETLNMMKHRTEYV